MTTNGNGNGNGNGNDNMSSSSCSPTNNGNSNNLVRALLTDLYQITMAYAHWRIGKADEPAVFELFFRKNPFEGEYTVFCGVDECLKLLRSFRFTASDIEYLRSTPALSHAEDGFFEYLTNIHETSMRSLKVYSVREGTVVFPRCPLLIVEGPLGVGHLLETTLLNLVNYPSLVATNASRMVLRAAGKPCIEFGLRRAQGPDGACSASKYSYAGGFVATSNVLAGKMFGVPISGTHAHSYIQSFTSLDDAAGLKLFHKKLQRDEVFLDKALEYRSKSSSSIHTNDSELAAFCAYACAFPNSCLCLIDTYDTLSSGLQNFLFVAKALDDFGYQPKGVRLDSGNLCALSSACRGAFERVVAEEPSRKPAFGNGNLTIVASNDINEEALVEFSNTKNGHGLTAFGIGTNLVTCQAQPALGCVYKLVESNKEPRIKLSQELVKVTVPGRKRVYRFYGLGPNNNRIPLVDYMCLAEEDPPKACRNNDGDDDGILCRNPFQQQDRIRIFPGRVEALHALVFDGGTNGAGVTADRTNSSSVGYDGGSGGSSGNSLSDTRAYVLKQLLEEFPDSITRYESPTRYDVLVSPKLYTYFHGLWEKNAPIPERR
eukprot:CAMPEP_0168179506 /NCGR_PEP_ID=MMETSP0139_2-20121125/9896_1 /TAXON_ID=44445 /ORGANISM="Pseudo-nitzschia australis, Strain 10249 10 AB" /LENGTH=601 /DNA_ID=CAMNT_0008099373 /DNA_START=76 /DNA_END=1881 /DNA_ORIENTATION=+